MSEFPPQPRTVAGRRLFSRLWAVSTYDEASRIVASVDADILAIEAEAAAPVTANFIEEHGAALASLVEREARLPNEHDFADTFCFIRRHAHGDDCHCRASMDEAGQIAAALPARQLSRRAEHTWQSIDALAPEPPPEAFAELDERIRAAMEEKGG